MIGNRFQPSRYTTTGLRLRVLIQVWIVFTLAFMPAWKGAWAAPTAQSPTPEEKAQAQLERLSPEERVGQLFVVTFTGTDVGPASTIYHLTVNYHIGGVVLSAANSNYTSGERALNDLLEMNRQLQLNRWSAAQQPITNPETGEQITLHYTPLYLGISQPDESFLNTPAYTGLTPLPSQMAMGATWDPDLVQQAGEVFGEELSKLGFNMLLGPALDVLENPQPESRIDLGTRTFGGDPFWVGKMGQAFITGVHQGAHDTITVVGKHFPGNGGADRPPDEEVATVRKTLEQLELIDLAPFFAVSGDAPDDGARVDALLTSHIRYQGFQENIRATTRPVSFDPQAITLLMSLPSLASWRENGGIMMSDNLGSQAVRNFYELTGQEYDPRRVALNAFLAGNDILYLGDVSTTTDEEPVSAIIRTLDFFTQKYREDPAFAQRVDESVMRILVQKYSMYEAFNLSFTLPLLDGIAEVGNNNQVIFDVARQAATLISPSLTELDDAIPDPPDQNDRIVFITDARTAAQCTQCEGQPILDKDALRQAVLRLYGPTTGSQVQPFNLTSYSYAELTDLLEGDLEDFQIERDLSRAHWIVFGMLDIRSDLPETLALKRFLSERPDLFQGKRLIVFSFTAPYYLDATNISKLTAYYGLYGYTSSFLDVAARLLFREIRPSGALPVSVYGIGYDLIRATSPDPAQIISLALDTPVEESGDASITPEPMPTPVFRVGDLIPIRTGSILDRNGNPVPDGTPVQFYIAIGGEVASLPINETTSDGVARTTIPVANPGLLEVRVESEPAKQSEILRFDISLENGVLPTPTATPEPTLEPTATPSPTIAAVIVPPEEPDPPAKPQFVDWLMALLTSSIIALVSYRVAAQTGRVRWGVRGAFLAVIGGLGAYLYLVVKMPGSETLLENSGAWGVFLMTSTGAIFGILVAWVWRYVQNRMRPESVTTH